MSALIEITERVTGGVLPMLAWSAVESHWAGDVGPWFTGLLQDAAPVGQSDTAGQLRDSIDFRQAGTRIEFFATAPYTRYVIGGTGPHSIDPVQAQALHFQVEGEDVFAAHVDHPGTRPNPFHKRTYQANRSEIVARFRGAVIGSLR